jgi:heat shock protein HslJ
MRVRVRPGRSTVLAVLLLLASCTGREEISGVGPGDGDAPPALDGRTFLSRSVGGHDLVPGTQIQLSFNDGNLGATAGCNSLGAPYSMDGSTLVIEGQGMTMTEIGCDPPRHDQDEWLSGFLTSSPMIELSANELKLTSGSTTIELIDREVADPDRPLVGTTWRVDTIIDGDAASSVPDGGDVILRFPTDTTFEASSEGCTSVKGEMTLGPRTISFADVAVDDIACPSPWAETLEVIDGVETTYRIEAARLTIDALTIDSERKGIAAVAVEDATTAPVAGSNP